MGDATEAAGSSVEAAVAIGTFVLIVSAVPAAPLVIGSFVIPAKVWMVIAAAGEGVKVVKEAKNIFLRSKVALRARGDADQANASPSEPTSKENSVEKWENVQITEAEMKKLVEEVRHLREGLQNLQKRPSTA